MCVWDPECSQNFFEEYTFWQILETFFQIQFSAPTFHTTPFFDYHRIVQERTYPSGSAVAENATLLDNANECLDYNFVQLRSRNLAYLSKSKKKHKFDTVDDTVFHNSADRNTVRIAAHWS